MEENIEPSTDSNIDVKKQEGDDEEENGESNRFGREDIALKYLTESKSNVHMSHSVISKFETKKTWNIINGESFSALNQVLITIKPQKLVVSIDTDPTLFPDFHQTISLLTKKEIETELYLHGHYHKEISGFSNDWVKSELNLKEFIGCLNEEGINNLPETLKTLHLAVDHTVLVALNNRLKELKELSFLGLRINLKRDVKNVPCLSSYTGYEMCLTLASDDEFDDDDEFAFWVVDITKQIICPVADIKQNVKLKGLWLQETHLTAEGIHKVLTEIHSNELTIIGQLKIWTKEEINPEEKEELNHQAIDMGLGGVIVYDILANVKEGCRPKTMGKGRSDINSINPDVDHGAVNITQKSSSTSREILIGVQHMTSNEKYLYNYEKAMEGPCHTVLVRVCEILFKGEPLLDKFNKLSHSKKKAFNTNQKSQINNGIPLDLLDFSSLELCIRVFGKLGSEIGPPCLMLDLCKKIKFLYNTFVHEKRTLTLNRIQFMTRMEELRQICESTLKELKAHDDAGMPSLDKDIADMRAKMLSLEMIE